MKKSQIIAIVLALVAAISVVVFFLTKNAEEPAAPVPENGEFLLTGSAYSEKITPALEGKVLLPTSAPGYFLTADLKNNVEFWTVSGNGFAKAPEKVSTVSVKLNVSDQSVPVKISYISVNGSNVGAGVFTSDMSGSVKYYDYAFVELVKMPSGYGAGYLLLADYTKEDFYKADKVYNDIFEYDMKASSVDIKLSQNTRLIDSHGTYRQDWDMMTDEFISNLGGAKYFMSSRYYTEAETGRRTDIMAYSSNYRPSIVAKDILGDWFVNDEAGMHYLLATDGGFKRVIVKDGKTSGEKEFSQNYFEDCLRSGNWIFDKAGGQAYNLLTDETVQFKGADFTNADVFSISPDGSKAVIAFYGENNANGVPVQKVVYAVAGGDADFVCSEPMMFAEESGFVWLSNGSVMSARASDDSGGNVGSVIYTYTAQ